ncbi:Crp/Fnr family transcriptional regulator [Roseateles sp.]|uniref:Crp/Fnr family transcriptional regulator n=1 Tax=Roseateles sp. TaxID=1971397 RepID=UPI003BA7A2BA
MESQPCPLCGPAFVDWLAACPQRSARWQALPRRKLRRGQRLLAQGETIDRIWWMEQGLARGFFLDTEGRERNHAFYAELDWLGAAGIGARSPWHLEALEAGLVVELSAQDLLDLQADWPQAPALIMQALLAGLARQTQREQDLLMLDAAARYQSFLNSAPALAERLSQKHIASYLGITEVALSRIRRRQREDAGRA